MLVLLLSVCRCQLADQLIVGQQGLAGGLLVCSPASVVAFMAVSLSLITLLPSSLFPAFSPLIVVPHAAGLNNGPIRHILYQHRLQTTKTLNENLQELVKDIVNSPSEGLPAGVDIVLDGQQADSGRDIASLPLCADLHQS